MISSALVSAARKIDTKPAKPRRRRGVMVAGAVLLTAAAGAAAAVIISRRRDAASYLTSVPADVSESADAASYQADAETPDPDMNGHPRIV